MTIQVHAVGMNPADFKRFAAGEDRSVLPMPVGYEVAGVIRAIGPDTEMGSGDGEGDLASPGRCVTTALHPRD